MHVSKHFSGRQAMILGVVVAGVSVVFIVLGQGESMLRGQFSDGMSCGPGKMRGPAGRCVLNACPPIPPDASVQVAHASCRAACEDAFDDEESIEHCVAGCVCGCSGAGSAIHAQICFEACVSNPSGQSCDAFGTEDCCRAACITDVCPQGACEGPLCTGGPGPHPPNCLPAATCDAGENVYGEAGKLCVLHTTTVDPLTCACEEFTFETGLCGGGVEKAEEVSVEPEIVEEVEEVKEVEEVEVVVENVEEEDAVNEDQCGNGILDVGEECDDGNRNDGDGCNSVCFLEQVGEEIDVCGDGVQGIAEECDDGNGIDGDGCSASCFAEESIEEDRTEVAMGVCGDDARDVGEECDDGNVRDGDGCNSACFLERGYCGDGSIQSALGETCEPALHDVALPYACNPATCRFLSPTCGNGTVDAGEECDLGTGQNANAPARQNEPACRLDCSRPRCGDYILDATESCDDGNLLSGDGCSETCTSEQGSATIPFPTEDAPTTPVPSAPVPPPWATITPITANRAPVGDTGPAALALMAAGAGAGVAWMRRKRR